MATPTNLPASFVTGAVLTAAQQNDLRGAFRVLQVVAGSTNTQTGSASGTYIPTTLSATITPQSTTSKILAMTTHQCSTSGSNVTLGIRLVQTIGGSATVIQTWTYALFSTASGLYGSHGQNVLISPSSTSAVTISTEMANTSSSGTVYTQTGSTYSNIILMEISA